MTEQQIEILERHFAPEGVIIFKEPDGSWAVADFGVHISGAMDELRDVLAGTADDPGLVPDILNKYFPTEGAPDG